MAKSKNLQLLCNLRRAVVTERKSGRLSQEVARSFKKRATT